VLDAACLFKLGTWGCAAALKVSDFEALAVLAELGAHTVEAGEALRNRPRNVLRKAADRVGRRIQRDHGTWLKREFGSDVLGRQDTQAAFAALDDVLGTYLPASLAFARADLDAGAVQLHLLPRHRQKAPPATCANCR
jgi:hypothetical protein